MRRNSFLVFAFLSLGLAACSKDKDNDGYKDKDDCDDSDAGIHPSADEICDGIDNDCDGDVDEGLILEWYADVDSDEYGDPDVVVSACNQPDGYTDNADDCNDASSEFHPGAIEDDCTDPNDYNCDGSVGYEDLDGDGYDACESDCDDTDPDVYAASTWYIDYDGDTYGSALYTVTACSEPIGYTDDFEDCDDLDLTINPETNWYPDADGDGYGDPDAGVQQCEAPSDDPELVYLLDDSDCDDTAAEVNPDTLWFLDADGDGYGYPGVYEGQCEQPEGYAYNADDCDDEDEDISPAGIEVCDGADNDCDAQIDEDDAVDANTYYLDSDGDGYGDPGASAVACSAPEGYAGTADDCDDALVDVNPGAEEVCNDTLDNDCDGLGGGTGDQCSMDLLSADGVFSGGASSEQGGTSVAAAGDLDFDGYDDFIVGAKGEATGGANSGGAYIISGGPAIGGESTLAETAGTILTGVTGDRAGRVVHGNVDLNSDGQLDVVISATAWNGSGTDRGRSFVVFGPMPSGSNPLSSVDPLEFTGRANYNYTGIGLASGDFNGDTIDDLLVGASGNDLGGSNRGTVYVLYGPLESGLSPAADVDDYLTGEGDADEIGSAIEFVGDINGDGNDDLLIGASTNETTGLDEGAAYIVFGPVSGAFDLASADIRFSGGSSLDQLGSSVGGAGDVDGDGTNDVVIGAPYNNEGSPDAGAVYMVLGDATSGDIEDAYFAKLTGAGSSDQFGAQVIAGGDVDDDGNGDVIVAAPGAGSTLDTGSVYAFYNVTEGTISASDADARFDGDLLNDKVGNSLAFVGDVDGSPNDAFLIGAQSDDVESLVDNGAVFLMLGIGL